jgi:uncharacterized protein (TIGR03067 family)
MTFKGESVTSTTSDTTRGGSIKADPSKKPKALDVTSLDGPDKGKTYLAVYEVSGDDLRISTAEPGKDRPTEVSSKEGNGWMLLTLKRVKK